MPEIAIPSLLTVNEVARLIRTTPRAIYLKVQRGQIPGVVRIGRRVLFDEAFLVRWIASSRAPSPEMDER